MKLNHVTMPVSDLERSVEFYARLGLRQIVANPPSYARFEMPDGDCTLSLAAGAGPVGGMSVHFESDRLDELVEELKQKGVEFEQDPVDQPYLWREAILRDPDGNVLFLYYAGENRLDPPWRLEETKSELVRRGYELWVRRDWDRLKTVFARDVELHPPRGAGGPPVIYGNEALRRFFEKWESAYEGFAVEVLEMLEAGDHVVSRLRVSGSGRASGATVTQEITHLLTIRDRRVVRIDGFVDHDDALRAAGLPPRESEASPTPA